ncbi:hypothetical protein D3C71_1814580 [compost metagenome]
MLGAEGVEQLPVGLGQGRGVTHQHRQGSAAEQLHVPQHLGFCEPAQHRRQLMHDRLQGLYQNHAVVDGNNVLAGRGTKTNVEFFCPGVPAHGNPGTAPIAEFRTDQGLGPLLRFEVGDA